MNAKSLVQSYLAEANGKRDKATVTLEGGTLLLITKWQGSRSLKKCVAELVRIADECLSEADQTIARSANTTPIKT